MKKLAIAVIAGLVSASAFAAQGDILARFRVINIAPDVKTSDTLSAVHVDVDNQTVPELDFTYMITNNIGAELILATARHEVTSDLGSLGKINHLPPTLTLQYHFNPEGQIRPYVGAGINYTRFYNNDLGSSVTGKVSVDKNSWGGALQVGHPLVLHALGGCRNRQPGHDAAAVVAHRSGNAAHPEFEFLVVASDARGAHR